MNSDAFTTTLDNAGLTCRPVSVQTLWMNITRRCNQSCFHCHVGSHPEMTEKMDRQTVEQCLKVVSELDSCTNLDITGGAPELHPDFDYIVMEAKKMGKGVTVRHNLTVSFDGDKYHNSDKGYLPYFFAENGVNILASLPHYDKQITDRIRGHGVFEKSINALKKFNFLGYGQTESELTLNLVYNCDGPVSGEKRNQLEAEFKEALYEGHGILFNSLLVVTNMPIGRFRSQLKAQGILEAYIGSLRESFSAEAVPNLTCRYLISVGHDGCLYDCDFNQALGMEVTAPGITSIYNFNLLTLLQREIRFGNHCFGCTAGAGSS